MPHIPLTAEEARWVLRLSHALMQNVEFTVPAPTEHAIVYILKHIK